MSPFKHLIEVDENCEIAIRSNINAKYIFVLNYSSKKVKSKLYRECIDHYKNQMCRGEFELGEYVKKVFKLINL